MMTPDADPDVTFAADEADLQDATCSTCEGASRIVDATTGESRPCSACRVSPNVVTREIDVPNPEMIARSVAQELDAAGAPRGRPSPMASLSQWVMDHLEAERKMRLLLVALFSGALTCEAFDDALRRSCSLELVLRRALSPLASGDVVVLGLGIEEEWMDVLLAVARLPGVDLTSHAGLCDALTSFGHRSRSAAPDELELPREGRLARVGAAFRRAWLRLRRGWEVR